MLSTHMLKTSARLLTACVLKTITDVCTVNNDYTQYNFLSARKFLLVEALISVFSGQSLMF